MRYDFDDLDIGLSDLQSAALLARVRERQSIGELHSVDEVVAEIDRQTAAVDARGRISLPTDFSGRVPSAELERLDGDLKADVGVLFGGIDALAAVEGDVAALMAAQLETLEAADAQLRLELADRQYRLQPGTGWTSLVQDSFEAGTSRLLADDETPAWLVSGLSTDGTAVPTAEVDVCPTAAGAGGKLRLAATSETNVGFKAARVVSASSPSVDAAHPPANAVDGDGGTFWLHAACPARPVFPAVAFEARRVAGTGTAPVSVLVSGDVDPRRQDHYVFVVDGNRGYVCGADPGDAKTVGRCGWAFEDRCAWSLAAYRGPDCADPLCPRRVAATRTMAAVPSGFAAAVDDGNGGTTGLSVLFSGEPAAGDAVRVSVLPSGAPGVSVELALELTRPARVNWLLLDPVVEAPCLLESVSVVDVGAAARPLLDVPVPLDGRMRLDFAPCEAREFRVVLRQPTYRAADVAVGARTASTSALLALRDADVPPTAEERRNFPLESLFAEGTLDAAFADFLPRSGSGTRSAGCLYALGLFEADCGLTLHAEASYAASRPQRFATPRLFAVSGNARGVAGADAARGTVEFSVARINYDAAGTALSADLFPVPFPDASGLVRESAVLDDAKSAVLRFPAASVASVDLVRLGASVPFAAATAAGSVPRTTVTVSHADAAAGDVAVVAYVPTTGVLLDAASGARLEDNAGRTLSLAETPFLVVAPGAVDGTPIASSDVLLRAVLRRASADAADGTALGDYVLFVSESDAGRF